MSVERTDPAQVTDIRFTNPVMSGQTVSGYGSRIPTRYQIKYRGRWHRVRMMQFGNAGSPYITVHGDTLFLDFDTEYRIQELGQ